MQPSKLIRFSTCVIPALMLCCGSVQSVHAADDTARMASQPQQSRVLCYFTDLRGKNVKGSDNDTVFEVKDVIFDRHSGDIAAYVVSDDRVILPSDVQSTADTDGAVMLRTSLTKDALKAKPEFDKDLFDDNAANDRDAAAWWNRLASESGKQIQSESMTYQPERIKSTDKVDISGQIQELERVRGEGDTYRTVAVIREKDGNMRTVILGPTWFLADSRSLPVRDQNVDLTVVPVEMPANQWCATSLKIDGGKKVTLREGSALTPVWYKDGNVDTAVAVQRRMLLASTLMGDDVKCREDVTGEVENLVVDHASNRVIALVVDPNDAWLGINDTTRLIPLSVASPSQDDLIYIDATKDMIVAAPAAPTKLNEMNNSWRLDELYKQRPIANR